jgi:hypothetical protein
MVFTYLSLSQIRILADTNKTLFGDRRLVVDRGRVLDVGFSLARLEAVGRPQTTAATAAGKASVSSLAVIEGHIRGRRSARGLDRRLPGGP